MENTVQNLSLAVIIICGVALFVLMSVNSNQLTSKKNYIKDLLERRNKKYKKNKKTKELDEEDDEDSAVTPDTIRNHEKEFNDLCTWHNTFAQLIAIFPLMGVFGTVTGLIQQMNANGGDILDGLSTALYTTAAGLVFAIVLKIFDSLVPARVISETDVMLDDFYKKLELADMYDHNKNGN